MYVCSMIFLFHFICQGKINCNLYLKSDYVISNISFFVWLDGRSVCWLVGWFGGDHLFLRDSVSYGIIFMMCVLL
jgi:hypothetical protein